MYICICICIYICIYVYMYMYMYNIYISTLLSSKVQTGEADMSLGGDQGGSIRLPSCWTGIVGLKPTYGLVPYTGIGALSVPVDSCGPMTRTIKDCALMLEVSPSSCPTLWLQYTSFLICIRKNGDFIMYYFQLIFGNLLMNSQTLWPGRKIYIDMYTFSLHTPHTNTYYNNLGLNWFHL
jgi:hypothetical protein